MLSVSKIEGIKAEIHRAATAHLDARDAETALSHFTDDVVAVSNTEVFPSRESLAANVREYYGDLKEVNYASWKDVHIYVVSERAATFTAKFVYGFTSMDDKITDLKGVWTALFVIDQGSWKIRLRH
ncbi:MAG: nuclear transport factor 2 family protein, partial [Bacteroidota bacterium]